MFAFDEIESSAMSVGAPMKTATAKISRKTAR